MLGGRERSVTSQASLGDVAPSEQPETSSPPREGAGGDLSSQHC